MPIRHFTLTTLSPIFIYGAENKNNLEPELRAASVRGQLRYWGRAIWGASMSNLEDVWAKEKSIFGATDLGSALGVRVFPRGSIEIEKRPLMPHRSDTKSQSLALAIDEAQRFEVQLVTRPGAKFTRSIFAPMQVWGLLGGVGKRSRRMFGAIYVPGLFEEGDPTTIEGFSDLIPKILGAKFACGDPATLQGVYRQAPAYPTLNPRYSCILVGQASVESATEGNRQLFGLLRSKRYLQHERVFGYASGGRRASPLIAQVKKVGDELYPVFTLMRSSDNREVKVLNDFMRDLRAEFGAQIVWGGEFK
jgi:CRISPR-associated protein Cmr1